MSRRRIVRMGFVAACAATALVAAAVAAGSGSGASKSRLPSSILFRGDFDGGNLSQWPWGAQCANTGVATDSEVTRGTVGVDSHVVGQGRFAARFNLPPAEARTACELLSPRPIGIDTDDYYGLMVRFPKKWREPSPAGWGVSLAQLNFENIWGPPVMLAAHANHVSLVLQSGHCSDGTSAPRGCQYSSGPGGNLRAMLLVPRPLSLGVWHELIVHVHWATNSSGVVEAWHRLKGERRWTKTVSVKGYPTLQWSDKRLPTLGYSETVDKIGAYRGPATWPLHYWEDDFVRARSFAAVAASLP